MAASTKVYWDSCLFFEWLGDEPVEKALKDGLDDVLDANDKSENIIVTSVITDLEIVPSKLEGKNAQAAQAYNDLFDSVKFHQLELTKNIITRAREIRDFYYKEADAFGKGGKMMDLGDAIHLATATVYNVDEFHTRDAGVKGSKVPLLGLYEYSGMDKVCDKYELKIISPTAQQTRLFG